jgi:FtsX-like permease family protein
VPDVYVPYWQWPMQSPTLIVRTVTNPATIASVIRSEVKTVNKNLPSPTIQTMDEILADSVAQPRFQTVLLSVFGILALFLAAVGIYGVVSYSVSQRTHEIGIRMALGAQKGNVLQLVVRQGLRLAFTGMAVGLAAAFVVTRVLRSLLYEVNALDPIDVRLDDVGLVNRCAPGLLVIRPPSRQGRSDGGAQVRMKQYQRTQPVRFWLHIIGVYLRRSLVGGLPQVPRGTNGRRKPRCSSESSQSSVTHSRALLLSGGDQHGWLALKQEIMRVLRVQFEGLCSKGDLR